MSNVITTWVLNFKDMISGSVGNVSDSLSQATKQGDHLRDSLSGLRNIDLFAIDRSVHHLKTRLQDISHVAVKNESALAEVSAITGQVGEDLELLNLRAKNLAKTYGEDTNVNLESFATILSRLGPDMAESSDAMELLGETVNVLSKTMKGDIKGATDAITTSMLQFQVDLNSPIKAAEEAKRMINVMAAGAKEGAAEIEQISGALEQAGVQANLANLSFEETNSAIQAMAEGGKYGSEAGVAIRNVITNMSASTKLTDTAKTILGAYGVNMKKVSDTSIPFAQRLKHLAPIQHDINALTEVFGRENAASAQILIRSADAQQALTEKITGSNVAYEQAAIIMDTTAEKEKRRTRHWELFKMKIGQVTKEYQAHSTIVAGAVSIMTNLKNAMDGLRILWTALTTITHLDTIARWIHLKITKNLTLSQLSLTISLARMRLAMLWTTASSLGFSGALLAVRGAVTAVSTAIMSIPVVGWILALITALVALFTYLWNHVGEFRGFFYGYWNVVKLVWSGIFKVISGVIQGVIALFALWWDVTKGTCTAIWGYIKKVWQWVVEKFLWAKQIITGVALGIWEILKNSFAPVFGFFKVVFGGAWEYVSDIFDRIRAKIDGFMNYFKPVIEMINGVWQKIKGAFSQGMQKGKKEVQEQKKGADTPKETVFDQEDVPLVKPPQAPVKTIDYDALFAGKRKGKRGKSYETSQDETAITGAKGNRVINTTVTMNNYFTAVKEVDIRAIAEKIVNQINDRLGDGLVAMA